MFFNANELRNNCIVNLKYSEIIFNIAFYKLNTFYNYNVFYLEFKLLYYNLYRVNLLTSGCILFSKNILMSL